MVKPFDPKPGASMLLRMLMQDASAHLTDKLGVPGNRAYTPAEARVWTDHLAVGVHRIAGLWPEPMSDESRAVLDELANGLVAITAEVDDD